MDPQDFNVNSRLRASDTDRDTAAAVVNNALAEGRLTPEEHADRLDAIFGAKTHAELVPLLDDLPAPRGVKQEIARPRPPDADLAPRGRRRLVAILSGFGRKGAWHPEPVMSIVTILGGAELDFRDAVLPGKEIVLRLTTILGGLGIIVPPDMRVVDNTAAILGGSDVGGKVADESDADSPVLRVEGVCILGGVGIERRERKQPKALQSGRGFNVSIDGGSLPAVRVKRPDEDD
ncbi:MAG TPA: DUF1707 domain-containing protein [Streptosporangiaceae bacterium]|nr:DUF1707 domain-containing protein [Streptosporangiaceae bacterium]